MPLTNRSYWCKKLDLNAARARSINARLRRRGILVIRIWEHQLRYVSSVAAAVLKIQTAREKRSARAYASRLFRLTRLGPSTC